LHGICRVSEHNAVGEIKLAAAAVLVVAAAVVERAAAAAAGLRVLGGLVWGGVAADVGSRLCVPAHAHLTAQPPPSSSCSLVCALTQPPQELER
jgi:hypothetical protein